MVVVCAARKTRVELLCDPGGADIRRLLHDYLVAYVRGEDRNFLFVQLPKFLPCAGWYADDAALQFIEENGSQISGCRGDGVKAARVHLQEHFDAPSFIFELAELSV